MSMRWQMSKPLVLLLSLFKLTVSGCCTFPFMEPSLMPLCLNNLYCLLHNCQHTLNMISSRSYLISRHRNGVVALVPTGGGGKGKRSMLLGD